MDLDTNVKKYKYSAISKILCVILCLATFCSSAWLAANAGIGLIYNYESNYTGESLSNDWTNSTEFYRLLSYNCNQVAMLATGDKEIAEEKKALNDNRDKYVEEAYKKVVKLRASAEKNPEEFIDDYDENGEEIYQTTVYYSNWDGYYEIVVGDKTINSIYVDASMSKEAVEKLVDDTINDFIIDRRSEGGGDTSMDARYFISFEGESHSAYANAELNEDEFYSEPYYLISKHGKVESKGINEDVVQDVIGSVNDSHKHFKDADFYFTFTPQKLSLIDSVASTVRTADFDFSNLYTLSLAIKDVEKTAQRDIIAAAILLAISLIFGFIYFSITGKREENEPAKLRFYDYIPFELGLGIAGGLGFGVGALCVMLADAFTISVLHILAIFLFALACWVLLFMLTASCYRYARSDKKFYKHLLTFWVFFALWKSIVWIFRQIGRLFKAIKRSAKRTANAFIYKPHHFKRNIILIAIGWLALNGILMAIIAACIVEGTGVGFLFAAVDIVMNFFAIRKAAEYMGNLDKIIDAASRHEEIMLDLEHLDQSLRVLAESMRYTNAELQNAIAKAVKDERLRTELITNVSHDLKTPLTSIITYVDLLSKCDIDDEKAQEYIKVLDEKGGKLKRLIDDLIEASKVTSGNVTVNLAPMNLSELCLQATVDAQSDFEKAGVELVVKQGEKPAIVVADGTKTNRVVENLLSNARKYSAKASRVYVSVYNEGDYGVFEIKNISAQPLDITPQELTERFVRGDKSRNQEGNGLGLSIAKELCTLQNGELELIIDGDLFKARIKLPTK